MIRLTKGFMRYENYMFIALQFDGHITQQSWFHNNVLTTLFNLLQNKTRETLLLSSCHTKKRKKKKKYSDNKYFFFFWVCVYKKLRLKKPCEQVIIFNNVLSFFGGEQVFLIKLLWKFALCYKFFIQ